MGSFEIKTKQQELIFPKGLMINPENRQYRTNEINFLFALNATIRRNMGISKKSYLVAGAGLKPGTFGIMSP
ncbi:hypothetical protein [Aquimarina algiphila]|uniref:hypothetical protein n=1 Tax=Aquimarina algiphila TaxID=2047982 RepID=UPI001ABF82EB|nr:hypothetical protein [Aquimarina algiphila]